MEKTIRNILFIGSSSNIVYEVYKKKEYHNCKFYGLTSKENFSYHKNIKIKNIHYDCFEELSNIYFNEIFILSTRPNSMGGSYEDFVKVNDMILFILSKIKTLHNSIVIFFSSISVYNKNIDFLDNNVLPEPNNNYGKAKLDLEFKLKNFSKNKFFLKIFRLPVLVYIGVNTNFLGKNNDNILNQRPLIFYNPEQKLSAIFDLNLLIDLINFKKFSNQLFICGCKPDITFFEISEQFKKVGAKNIEWRKNDLPSVIIDFKSLEDKLKYTPSAKLIFRRWIENK